jgi:hypothetical protein
MLKRPYTKPFNRFNDHYGINIQRRLVDEAGEAECLS